MPREFDAKQPPPPRRTPCPPGTFLLLAEKLRKRRHRRVFLRTAVVSTAVAAGTGLSLWLGLRESGQRSPAEYHYGGIACSEVQKLASSYGRGELAAPIREKVRQHVAQCPHCGPRFGSMGLET
jgi:hypothetical protein